MHALGTDKYYNQVYPNNYRQMRRERNVAFDSNRAVSDMDDGRCPDLHDCTQGASPPMAAQMDVSITTCPCRLCTMPGRMALRV